MAITNEFLAEIRDLFAPMGEITTRKMFGGGGIYCDGLIFAIADDGRIYVKGDQDNISEFEDAGMEPFSYINHDGQRMEMKYYQLPLKAHTDSGLACEWGQKGLDAAHRAAAKTKSKPK